jgi:MFS family permease
MWELYAMWTWLPAYIAASYAAWRPDAGGRLAVGVTAFAAIGLAGAAGCLLGGRLADRHPHKPGMARAALLGAALVALIPLVAIPLLGVTDDSLSELSGSLLALLVLVGPPVLVLGALSPWAIRLSVRSVAAAGDATGRLYALSTAGGLVGNFLAALALIPLVGTRWTFLICAVLLAAVSAPVAWSRPA